MTFRSLASPLRCSKMVATARPGPLVAASLFALALNASSPRAQAGELENVSEKTSGASAPSPDAAVRIEVDALPADEAAESVPSAFVLPRQCHPWGRFENGAWRTTRLTTEITSPSDGQSTHSIVEQTEVLRSIDTERYVLDVQATVEIGGKKIVGSWRQRELSLVLDRPVFRIEHKFVGDTSLPVDFVDVPCRLWELFYEADSQPMVDRIYYSGEQPPFLLQRESIEQTNPEDRPIRVKRIEFVALQLPLVVDDEPIQCDCRRTSLFGEKGRTTEIAFVCDAIPGGEALLWSTDWDIEGRQIRSTRMELVDYGDDWDVPESRMKQRRQLRQQRRQSR